MWGDIGVHVLIGRWHQGMEDFFYILNVPAIYGPLYTHLVFMGSNDIYRGNFRSRWDSPNKFMLCAVDLHRIWLHVVSRKLDSQG